MLIPALMIAAFLALMPVRAAYAANCANPTGVEGNMIFNDAEKLMQYCNGTDWIGMGRRPLSSGTVSSTNLIGHWTLDGVSGNTTAADSSGNNFTGTLTNMNTTTAWGAGQVGNSLTFDGTDDFVRIPFNSTLDYKGTTLTLSAWINSSNTTLDRRIVSMPGDETTGTEKYGLMISGGMLQFWIGEAFAADNKAQTPFTSVASWHHVAGTYDGSNMKLYLDGTLVSTVAQTGNIRDGDPAKGPLLIGSYGADWTQYFAGKIDDVRVYTRTLSAPEIAILAGISGGGSGCLNPAGTKGTIIYNGTYHVPQFCNGDNWIAMASAGAGGAGCTGPVGAEGKILYNSNFHIMQYCDGVKWSAIGHRPPGSGSCGVTSGLAGYWKLNEGSGTTAVDSSSGGHDGTLSLLFGSLPQWTTGKQSGALQFNTAGSGNYVDMGDINAMDGMTQMTASVWVKSSSAGANNSEVHFLDKSACDGLTNSGSFELLSIDTLTGPEFVIYPTGGTPTTYIGSGVSSVNVDDGNWHLVTGTYDGNILAIYVDGVLRNSNTIGAVTMSSNARSVSLGGRCNGSNYFYDGDIDEARVYNRALSAGEITSLYNSGAGCAD